MDAGATLIGAVVGALAILVAMILQQRRDGEAELDRRAHDAVVTRRAETIQAAKDVLQQLNQIRTIFDPYDSSIGPNQSSYEQYFHLARLYTIGIDDKDVADTLDRICKVYWAAARVTEDDRWTARQLGDVLDELARTTVHAYIHGEPKPDLAVLAEMEGAIESTEQRWSDQRQEEVDRVSEEKARNQAQHELAAERQRRLKERAAQFKKPKIAPPAASTPSEEGPAPDAP